jgi:hypothetical protein
VNRKNPRGTLDTSLTIFSDNTVLCSEFPRYNQHPVTHRKLATISPDAARELPRIFLNCILGVSAVNMAVRNPGNGATSQLALETKVGVFEVMNIAFKQPYHHRADVLYGCILLMFVMEVRMQQILFVCHLALVLT